jgi:hypothetical protein
VGAGFGGVDVLGTGWAGLCWAGCSWIAGDLRCLPGERYGVLGVVTARAVVACGRACVGPWLGELPAGAFRALLFDGKCFAAVIVTVTDAESDRYA